MPSKNPDLGNKRPGFTSQLCPDSMWLHSLISFLVPTSDHGHRIKWHVIIKTRTKPGKNIGIQQTSTKYDINWILSFNLSFILGLRKFHLSDSWTASPVSPPWSSPQNTPAVSAPGDESRMNLKPKCKSYCYPPTSHQSYSLLPCIQRTNIYNAPQA